MKDGKGSIKEYKNSILIYEGEYFEGKRHGKGKEYNNSGELIFEGEYLYGFKNKGIEYDNKKIIFKGEYFNEQKWNGIKKDYYYDKIIFEGEYMNGIKNGKGKEYNNNGELEFEGEYYKNQRISFISNNQKDYLTKFNIPS